MPLVIEVYNGAIQAVHPRLPKIILRDGLPAPIEPHSLNAAERLEVGIIEVEDRGREEFDERFQEENVTDIVVEPSLADPQTAHRTFSVAFKHNARALMEHHIHLAAASYRAQYEAAYYGLDKEYAIVEKQAMAALREEAAGTDPQPEDYPALAADIGITINEQTGAECLHVLEVAQLTMRHRQYAEDAYTAIRNRRLYFQDLVRNAATDAEAVGHVAEFANPEFTSAAFGRVISLPGPLAPDSPIKGEADEHIDDESVPNV